MCSDVIRPSLHVNRMRLRGRRRVLAPYLNRLVRFTGDQAAVREGETDRQQDQSGIHHERPKERAHTHKQIQATHTHTRTQVFKGKRTA